MYFLCIYLLGLATAKPYEPPTFQSSVTEDEKPILRMLPEPVSVEIKEPFEDPETLKLQLVAELTSLLEWLVRDLGYDVKTGDRRDNGNLKSKLNVPFQEEKEPTGSIQRPPGNDMGVSSESYGENESGEASEIHNMLTPPQPIAPPNEKAFDPASGELMENVAEAPLDNWPQNPPSVLAISPYFNQNAATDNPDLQMPPPMFSESPIKNAKRDGPTDDYSSESSSESYDENVHAPLSKKKQIKKSQAPPKSPITVGREQQNKKPSPPSWLLDLKTFMENSYGAHGLHNEQNVKSVVKALEKKHRVHIRDIDLTANGDIEVDYVSYVGSQPRIAREGNYKKNRKTESKKNNSDSLPAPTEKQTKPQDITKENTKDKTKENIFETKPYKVLSVIPGSPDLEVDTPSLPELSGDRLSVKDRSSYSVESNDSDHPATLRMIEHVTGRLERRGNNIDV